MAFHKPLAVLPARNAFLPILDYTTHRSFHQFPRLGVMSSVKNLSTFATEQNIQKNQFDVITPEIRVGPLKHYSNLLNSGVLQPDRNQFLGVNRLQHLFNQISDLENKTRLKSLDVTTKKVDSDTLQAPKGVYLHGEVGTGKTVLLDIFYDCLPMKSKKRVHFHNFLLHLYSVYNKWNLCLHDNIDKIELQEPTEYVADQLLENARIICFDEIQVADFGSCSLLYGVFKHLFKNGAVVVGTSNRSIANLGDSSISQMDHDGEHPCDETFESVKSFKGLLQSNCITFHLDSQNDYRMNMKPGKTAYFAPINDANEERFDQIFYQKVGKGAQLKSQFVKVYGRKILIPIASRNGVARFTAKDLFQQSLGPADYIQICNKFNTVFIDRIFKMNLQQRNEARRFLSFIDAAYESKTKIFCLADANAENLFTMLPREGEDGKGNIGDSYEDQMHFEMIGEIAYDLAITDFDYRSLGIITGEDEIFSFRRAISRLKEMQSLQYQQKSHRAQMFSPYTGTAEEKSTADDNRRKRMDRRKKRMEEIEANGNDEFSELRSFVDETRDSEDATEEKKFKILQKKLQDMDWGDEASYKSLSQTVAKKRRFDEILQKLAEKRSTMRTVPKIAEKHFWGFGWWQKAIKRFKSEKPEESDK
eukprot:gene13965-15422_t